MATFFWHENAAQNLREKSPQSPARRRKKFSCALCSARGKIVWSAITMSRGGESIKKRRDSSRKTTLDPRIKKMRR
jgi:hypothetical protein